MRAVHKYTIWFKDIDPEDDSFEMNLPKGAEILCIKEAKGLTYLWALVDKNVDLESRKFYVRGTGHSVNDNLNLEYISTIILLNGEAVWHYFIEK